MFGRNYDMETESMPQTVPSADQPPPQYSYSFTADSFDLSLLPPDGEVPVSPRSLRHLMTLFGDHTTSPEPMFSAEQEDYLQGIEKIKENNLKDFNFPTTILEDNIPQLKSPTFKTEINQVNQYHSDQTVLFEQFHNFGYQSPLYPTPSPSSDEGSNIPTFNIQPCSPFDGSSYPSPNLYSTLLTVKEEPNIHLSPQYSGASPYPHSPASSCTSYSNHPSPNYIQPHSPSQYITRPIKDEAAIDIEEFLKENQILQDSLNYSQQKDQENSLVQSNVDQVLLTPKEEKSSKPRDYQLLREVLQDTSFQKRLNLKPLNFDSLTSGYNTSSGLLVKMEEPDGLDGNNDTLMTSCSNVLARDNIEPVLSMAIEQMRKDVETTCSVLGISPDPVQWSGADVKAWLLWTLQQYSLPLVPVEYFCMDGARLAALNEQDFVQRAPQAGSTLFAKLEIWKAARQEGGGMGGMSVLEGGLSNQEQTTQGSATGGPWGETSQHTTSASGVSNASSNEEASDDEDEDISGAVGMPSAASTPPATAGKPAGTGKPGGAHIHLWQFLKELLASPQLHGSAIRWLDRGKGVFKIEDSVRVARLWGKRKNRPAMNYDKLSRSIRQYYKKGIMKKTERSQRLVYQFCHPYCL